MQAVQPIPITVENGAIQKEMMLLEFQGEFEHSEIIDGKFGGIELGRITERAGGNYELKVGSHLLRGK